MNYKHPPLMLHEDCTDLYEQGRNSSVRKRMEKNLDVGHWCKMERKGAFLLFALFIL